VESLSLIPRWLDAFEKEVIQSRHRFGTFDTLYLGGGTPSVLNIRDLERINEVLASNFSLAADTEITIEVNPGDLTKDKARGLKSLGFNRVNLGVQSLDDRELAFLGRRHTAGEAEKALRNLRYAGFENIGIDLMYGIPGQSLKAWVETLTQALGFQPEHISCYQLTLEKGTAFWKMREQGLFRALGQEQEREFFLATSSFLEDAGYIQYEISNFARDPALGSRHNRKYWFHIPYLGLGPSAHSFGEGTRWWNLRTVIEYCAALERGYLPVAGRERLTKEQIRLEAVSLGLRTNHGVELTHITGGPKAEHTLRTLQDAGLIQVSNGRLKATRQGFLVADRLPLCFFP
jgi:oxygen-independent coproporphyrinogen-3 oxidase